MKKIVYLVLAVVAISVYSCQKDNTSKLKTSSSLKTKRDTTPPGAASRLIIQKDTTPPGK